MNLGLTEFLYINLAFIAATVIVSLYIFSRISQTAERASEREHEIRKLQIQEKILISNPLLITELDRLQRQFSLIAMGIRGGWIPFVLMYLQSMTHARISVDGKSYDYHAWIPSTAVVVGLVAFYAFLFNRAFHITAKIKETEAQISIKAPTIEAERRN